MQRDVEGARLVEGQEPLQVVDQHQPVVEPDHPRKRLELGRNVRGHDDFVLRPLEHAFRVIHHQDDRVACGMRKHKPVCRGDGTVGHAEPPPDIQDREHPATHIDDAENDWRRGRQRRHLNSADHPIHHRQREGEALPVEAKDEELRDAGSGTCPAT